MELKPCEFERSLVGDKSATAGRGPRISCGKNVGKVCITLFKITILFLDFRLIFPNIFAGRACMQQPNLSERERERASNYAHRHRAGERERVGMRLCISLLSHVRYFFTPLNLLSRATVLVQLFLSQRK